jgi:predicted membrane GTPase involved in stress response
VLWTEVIAVNIAAALMHTLLLLLHTQQPHRYYYTVPTRPQHLLFAFFAMLQYHAEQMLTVTRGTAVMDTIFDAYRPYAGDIEARDRGSLIAHEDGPVTSNGILGAQDRGSLFCSPKVCWHNCASKTCHQQSIAVLLHTSKAM